MGMGVNLVRHTGRHGEVGVELVVCWVGRIDFGLKYIQLPIAFIIEYLSLQQDGLGGIN